jgi:hypothetical protein
VSVHAIAEALAGYRFSYASEDDLQAAIADVLASKGFPVEREVRLGALSRLDLLVGRVAIEVKVAGRTPVDQVRRYLMSERVDGLVLVTSRVGHRLPEMLDGKPIRVVQIAGMAL